MDETAPIDHVRRMLGDFIGGPDTPYMARREQAKRFAESFALPPGLRAERDHLGGVPVEWIVPDGAGRTPVLFHLHGGGYVLGDPAGSRPLTTAFALKSGARVVSIDYRLAPEHPFPAAVEDASKAYRALLALDTPARALAVGGESAGGGLALATLIGARDAGLALPACAFAVSPWCDLACTAPTFETQAALDPLLTRRSLKEMGDAYLAGADARAPLASPLYGDLAGLPPLLIHVGSDEVLLDDARQFQTRAVAAGVESRLEIWDGMIHVWHMFHPMLPQGARAIDGLVDFVKSHWR